ncbi:virulence factor TspB C-terminal domain-related protein [Psychrobacter sp. NPDC078501]|uniref:virulence factor TspB C-terminal domain-related protein n=1 Tax=Psychrobacter sp. NPDC078501 TaxID=3364495 RepID=UPI00384ED877
MKAYIKRFFIFGLSAILVIAPAAAYATTSLGGWTATDTVIAGATTTINAIKNGANGALKSAVTVAPSASKVGKFLIKGGGAAALLIAVPQLLGEGVDWVLDPANNGISYNSPSDAGGFPVPSPNESWQVASASYLGNFSTAIAAANVLCSSSGYTLDYVAPSQAVYCKDSAGASNYTGVVIIDSKDPSAPYDDDGDGFLPIDTVAAQVISNAASGEPASQDAVKATALEGFAAGEHDAALDAASEPDVGTENPPDTTDPENPPSPTDPAVPFDPSSIIAAINALKAMLAGIMSSITGLSDFVQSSPETPTESTDVVVDAPIDDFETDKNYITFSGSCPPNYSASLSIMGNTVPFSFDYAPICTVMAALKPFIVGAGYLTAAYIIAGYSRGTNG